MKASAVRKQLERVEMPGELARLPPSFGITMPYVGSFEPKKSIERYELQCLFAGQTLAYHDD